VVSTGYSCVQDSPNHVNCVGAWQVSYTITYQVPADSTFTSAGPGCTAAGSTLTCTRSVPAGTAANIGAKGPEIIQVGERNLPAVPKGAVGIPTETDRGLEYKIPPGTPELSERVASIRIMDPTTTGKYPYPNGYAAYMNSTGQTINPLTGETIADADPLAHISLP
jgi:hypothetical protein